MIFTPINLERIPYVIELEKKIDGRGFFSRAICAEEFSKIGLNANFIQQSISFNHEKGTLRGMHWQESPCEEEKLVRVTKGSVFDVIVDIRPESKTFKKWHGIILSDKNHLQIYIPTGYAHGFQTLEADTEVLYQMTTKYSEGCSRGFIWNDQGVNIEWPVEVKRIISERDLEFKPLHNEL